MAVNMQVFKLCVNLQSKFGPSFSSVAHEVTTLQCGPHSQPPRVSSRYNLGNDHVR